MLAQTSISRRETSNARKCCSSASCCRRLISISELRRRKSPGVRYDIARNGALQQYQALHRGTSASEPGQEGSRRHRRSLSLLWRHRTASCVGRRLCRSRDQNRIGDAHESVARQPHGAGAVFCRSRRRPSGVARSRCRTRTALRRSGPLRIARAPGRLSNARRGSAGSKRLGNAQARIVCDGANRARGPSGQASSSRRPPSARCLERRVST